MTSSSPYKDQAQKHFWKTGVALSDPLCPSEIYRKKWQISYKDKLATAGSCFAQHIGRNLKRNGFNILDKEPPPLSLNNQFYTDYGYGLYSARYGNIYTVRQLLQLAEEAFGHISPRFFSWEKSGKYYDALRPNVEPQGYDSVQELIENRLFHLDCVCNLFKEMDVFIFTLGLTESWVDELTSTVLPTAPGVIAGNFNTNKVFFKNFTFSEIMADFVRFIELMEIYRESETPLRFLLTVSPVPLTATATPEHIILANTYSKSILRAIAGQLSNEYSNIDYFPSFEIISNLATRGIFYENNLRTVTHQGVDTVMRVFFSEHNLQDVSEKSVSTPINTKQSVNEKSLDEIACEEQLLESFLHDQG